MSRALLARVRDADVLRGGLPYEALEAVHVPFDDLVGDSGTEAALARAAAAYSTVILTGRTGTGKSSILAYELGQLSARAPETLVPMRIPMEVADPEQVAQVGDFARHIVRHITRSAAADRFTPREKDEFARLTGDLERRTGRRRRAGASLTAPLVVTNAGLALELESAGSEIQRRIAGGEVVQALNDLMAIVRAQGAEPFLVFDDTDVWLRSVWGDRSEALVTAFFGRNVRTLVREVDCGFALAAHTEYLEQPGFHEAIGLIDHRIEVPHLPDAEAGIARILGRRLEFAAADVELGDVFAPEAFVALSTVYSVVGPDLRALIGIAGQALRAVLDDPQGPDRVSQSAVNAAAARRLGR